VGTSPLSSIHHDRLRIDEMREPNKAALTGGRPSGLRDAL
jgi:hypothetical protein